MQYSRILFIILCLLLSEGSFAKRINKQRLKFRIDVPESMSQLTDSAASEGELYYDSSARVVLMISARRSEFHSVNEYLDCSRTQLESQLRIFYTDSTLKLIACSRSQFYPKKSVVISFSVDVAQFGFNTFIVYFIHHRHRDIQLAFAYKMQTATAPAEYVNTVMRTLKLK